eukprot:s638_g23.t1
MAEISQEHAPPGVAADRFKVIKMEAVQIRALIGRGGETIQEIRRNSGSEVKIDHQPSEPVGTVTIIGDLVKTEQMIMDALSAKGCPIGGPPARGGGGGGNVANAGVPREIAIPHDLVGGLIERRVKKRVAVGELVLDHLKDEGLPPPRDLRPPGGCGCRLS